MQLYIGDTGNLKTRVRTNHCSGNINGSALRRHVALAMGFEIGTVIRPSGTRKRILLVANPQEAEDSITHYIRNGMWRNVQCNSAIEAKDFQYFAIQMVNPVLNINHGHWNIANRDRYNFLFEALMICPLQPYNNLADLPRSPGVYLLEHNQEVPVLAMP